MKTIKWNWFWYSVLVILLIIGGAFICSTEYAFAEDTPCTMEEPCDPPVSPPIRHFGEPAPMPTMPKPIELPREVQPNTALQELQQGQKLTPELKLQQQHIPKENQIQQRNLPVEEN